MYVEYLETRNFRNLLRCSLHLEAGKVAICGDNAQGKTNLLEALYVCVTGRSFRGSASQLIAHGESSASLRARFVRQTVTHDIEVQLTPGKRYVRVDGRGLRQASQLLELVNVVAFFPDDLRIAKGAPEERRRFLDRIVGNCESCYVELLMSYRHALKSRNAVLKAATNIDPLLIRTYDEQLCAFGSRLHNHRAKALEIIRPIAQCYYSEMMGEASDLTLTLTPGLGTEPKSVPKAGYAAALQDALTHRLERDRALKVTSAGPHRSDLVMHINGKNAKLYASQGQQRAIVLALKMAEMTHLKSRLNSPPILLLDDVSSELDRNRTALLFDVIEEVAGQVWLSTTGATPLPFEERYQKIRVVGGVLSAV